MAKLPRISGRECVKALQKVGYQINRQHGSHIILRELNRGTLRAVLRSAGISIEEFIELI